MTVFNTFQNKKLLNEAQQNGFKLIMFKDILKDITRKIDKIKSSEILDNGNVAVIDQGKNRIAGYVETSCKISEGEKIVFGDHTRVLKYINTPFIIGADGTKVLEIASDDYDTKYIYYYLKSVKLPDAGYSRHFKYLKKLIIPVPSIKNQQKIVKILDKANSLIKIREKQLQEMDNLIQSVFMKEFGNPLDPKNKWQRKKISEMLEVKSGSTPSRENSKYWKDGEIAWVKTNEVLNNYIDRTGEKITSQALEETSVKLFPKNTLLIAMYGQGKTRGRTALLNIEATTNQACAGIIPNDDVNMHFIFHQIRFSYEDLRNLARGGNQPNLNLGLIKKYELIFPPLNIQNEFISFVKEVESRKKGMQESLKLMEESIDALMQKAFDGELVSE